MNYNLIDTNFDTRIDSNNRDPDKYSNTLKKYHKELWSKLLPNWNKFELNDMIENIYLYHKSNLWEYFLSSDSIIHSYSKWTRMKNIIDSIPKNEIDDFLKLAYTIWWYIIFPSNKINNLATINQERWCNKKICDRFDLTLECIRLYYNNEDSPLKETLSRYNKFFNLFNNFKWYCEYFLLSDLVSEDYNKIKFFIPFYWFENTPTPKTIDEYYEYKNNNINFLINRNKRINNFISIKNSI